MKRIDCLLTIWQKALGGLFLMAALSACATEPSTAEIKERQTKAQAMFAERCKVAGERIHRTVDDVAGIYLLKIRPEGVNYGDQFKMDDPYGSDLGGEAYLKSFLRGFFEKVKDPTPYTPPHLGYLYVEAVDPKDGKRYRYTGRMEEPWQTNKAYLQGYIRFVMDKAPAPGAAPRYGVTYDDISTREEREYWIAGSSLRVVDLQTNEVIAERVGYMMDPYQGSQAGQRSPWLLAANTSCPAFLGRHASSDQIGQAEKFVGQVLKPKIQGE